MDRTIASVAVWPVFIVHFKFNFWEDFLLFRAAVDVAWDTVTLFSLLVENSNVTNSVAALRRKRKVTLQGDLKKKKKKR